MLSVQWIQEVQRIKSSQWTPLMSFAITAMNVSKL